MAFRMSEQPRTIKIYNLLAGTNEFIGEGDAYIPPHTGLPANSTYIAPPDIPAGFVAVFNSDESFPAIIDFTYFLHERICTSSQQRPSMTFRTSVGQRTMLSSDVVLIG